MGRSPRLVTAASVFAMLWLNACGAITTAGARAVPLPTSGPLRPCAGIGLGTLRLVATPGDSTSPMSARVGDHVVRITWPTGFTADFEPQVVVRWPDGTVFASDGDVIPAVGHWNGRFVCTGTDHISIFDP